MPNNEKQAFQKTFKRFLTDTHCFSIYERVTFDDVHIRRQHIEVDSSLVVDLKVEGTRSSQLTTSDVKRKLIDCTAMNYDSLTVSLYQSSPFFNDLSPELSRDGISGTFALIVAGIVGLFALLTTTIYFISSKRQSEKRLEELAKDDNLEDLDTSSSDEENLSPEIDEENNAVEDPTSTNDNTEIVENTGDDANEENDENEELSSSKEVERVVSRGGVQAISVEYGQTSPLSATTTTPTTTSSTKEGSNGDKSAVVAVIESLYVRSDPSNPTITTPSEIESQAQQSNGESEYNQSATEDHISKDGSTFVYKPYNQRTDDISNCQDSYKSTKCDEEDISHLGLSNGSPSNTYTCDYKTYKETNPEEVSNNQESCHGSGWSDKSSDCDDSTKQKSFCYKPYKQIAPEDESNHQQGSCYKETSNCDKKYPIFYKPYKHTNPDDETIYQNSSKCPDIPEEDDDEHCDSSTEHESSHEKEKEDDEHCDSSTEHESSHEKEKDDDEHCDSSSEHESCHDDGEDKTHKSKSVTSSKKDKTDCSETSESVEECSKMKSEHDSCTHHSCKTDGTKTVSYFYEPFSHFTLT